jgi:hypothetical protein
MAGIGIIAVFLLIFVTISREEDDWNRGRE